MKRKLIIDADPGIGDALAITLAVVDPDIDLVAVTTCPGCVGGEMALLNAQAVASILDPPRWPRLGMTEGRAIELPKHEGLVEAVFLHGETGLGDLDVPAVELHHRVEAAKLLVELVRDAPGQITLLTLGPLTNVLLACERFPEFLMSLKELVCCGGTMAAPGDVAAVAEFNMYANPQAARGVLGSPATKTLVPLDVTSKVVLSFDQYNRLKIDPTTRLGRLIEQTIPFALRAQRQHLGREGLPLHEATALAAIAAPRLFERKSFPIDVELKGELTRGMTVFDRRKNSPRAPNIDVLTDVDSQGVLDYVAERLKEARR